MEKQTKQILLPEEDPIHRVLLRFAKLLLSTGIDRAEIRQLSCWTPNRLFRLNQLWHGSFSDRPQIGWHDLCRERNVMAGLANCPQYSEAYAISNCQMGFSRE